MSNPNEQPSENQPPIGSWASVARLMAQDDDSGIDWDAWKDEMKDQDITNESEED